MDNFAHVLNELFIFSIHTAMSVKLQCLEDVDYVLLCANHYREILIQGRQICFLLVS